MPVRGRLGFTLIELSIVLVLLGLLAGGVLVGRELVAAARLQKTVGQVAQFKAAVGAFQRQYDFLPGDLPDAEGRGLVPATDMPVKGGNGDGLVGVEDTLTPGGNELNAYEPTLFWAELGAAGLVAGVSGCYPGASSSWGWLKYGTCWPLSALPYAAGGGGDGSRAAAWFVRKYPDGHYFQLTSATGDDAGFQIACGASGGVWCNALTPADAAALDRKLDDGLPGGGTVRAFDAAPPVYSLAPSQLAFTLNNPTSGPAGGSTYVTSAVPPAYNVTSADPYRCSLNVRAGF